MQKQSRGKMIGNKKMSTFMLEKHSVLDVIKLVEFISMCDKSIETNSPNVVLPELLRIEQIPISFELESEYFTFLRDKNANAIDVRFTFKRNNSSEETDVIDMKFLLAEKGWDAYAQSSSDYAWLFSTLIKITKNIICVHNKPGCIHFPITWGKIKN